LSHLVGVFKLNKVCSLKIYITLFKMENSSLNNTYVAVEGGKYVTKTETISSQAAPGHLLIKIAYSTCNPYDYICYN
jgi:hypothetical protein